MTLKPELTAVLIVPVLFAGLFIVHVNLGAFLAFFCLHSGHAHNENFDKYFLVFFFPVQGYGRETLELQLSLHTHTNVILLTDWNKTLFTLAQLRSDLA